MSINATGINDSRYRMQFRFWLDAKNDFESWLADECAKLKSVRRFQTVVRDALRLYLSLQSGDLSVLQEQFPFAAVAATPALVHEQRPLVEVKNKTSNIQTIPELEIKRRSDGGQTATLNFFKSMSALGIDMSGAIANMEKQQTPVAAAPAAIKKIAGSEIELAIPTFDDIEI